ncbi:DUF1549 and DUF1553 domain-containing protein [Limnoglobus roseus]|uniref:DUF1553 domain-containing protein n=1 Tax=Limnoglobus roseus TaxID=2598579 RepID=A0A5C1AH29_9BACT|nr:DUF1549 and DUF1553 domain-containing protein [Limnoglobus roseus]QEL17935.1 hypothetical protein PX52LOC_04948 [Limnoglobus roseus]
MARYVLTLAMLTHSVQLMAAADAFHFENQISPLLARYNCNSSGCHGKAEGQGGFKLSVFGFDPVADYASIVKEARGRRVMASAAEESLFLRKATGRTPHGGGTRIKGESNDYRTLRDWIAAGMPVGDPNAPRVSAIRVEPPEKVMANRATLPVRAFAQFTDGRETEVTEHAKYQTNHETLAAVSVEGVITTGDAPGEVAVMASYLGNVAVCRVMIPQVGKNAGRQLPQFNFIDEWVDRKLAKLNIVASEVCDDATFFRRVHLDLVGLLPKPDEVRAFLSDTAKDKRAKAIDRLIQRPEFADLMALRWADLLRVNRQVLGPERAYAYFRWVRESFAKNKPFDEFARELVTAEGPVSETPPANFFKVAIKPGDAASTLSQVFLGIRIACAECHHHPSDRWTQADYAGMLAFFAPVTSRGSKDADAILSVGDPVTRHPRSGSPVYAHALGVEEPTVNPAGDRRVVLASWMTEPSNPYFARNFANRIWANLLGRGIVEPVDDVRATNPPSNPDLLDALAKFAAQKKYDTRELVRLICNSRAYQSSSVPNASNEKDEQNFSRVAFRRPSAEVLLDMIGQATGVGDRFAGLPPGTRAVQVWDSETKQPFLKLFGRPSRTSACECERNAEPSTAQVLNLMNSPDLQWKLSHVSGNVAKWQGSGHDAEKICEEIYLTVFSRRPTKAERENAVQHLKARSDRRAAIEDLTWALLNSLEFSFNH